MRLGAIVVACALVTLACGDDDDVASVTEDAEWGYEGAIGPENWGELDPDYTACVDGSAQSPIDLTGATERNITDIGFDYAESPLHIVDNGHTIEVEYEEGGDNSIELEPAGGDGAGETFDVLQFHFHAGSEHLIDGQSFPMELHIVHASADEELAVVGIMVNVGAENEALAAVFDNIPTEESEEPSAVAGATVDLAAVLPDTLTYFQYDGSLTTPPCSENVSWQVLDTPIEVSEAQLRAFTAVVDDNVRPPRPLGDRELDHDTGSDE